MLEGGHSSGIANVHRRVPTLNSELLLRSGSAAGCDFLSIYIQTSIETEHVSQLVLRAKTQLAEPSVAFYFFQESSIDKGLPQGGYSFDMNVLQPCSSELGTGQSSAIENSALEIRPVEVGLFEIRSCEIRSFENRPSKICTLQIRTA